MRGTATLDLILHHYDPSPYSEKVRLIFGLKKLAWRSVIVPMVLPKPTLMPLTGGFRRTPVLQIGADVYCDTLRIAAELDRRFPTPRVMPADTDGLSTIIGTWAERVLMWPTARYVTGLNRDFLPESFFADRAAMRGHALPDPQAIARSLPHQRRQLELMLGWIENLLADGRAFLVAGHPVLADLAVYQRLWWLGALEAKATDLLGPYPRICAWMARIAAAGHGMRREMTAAEALDVARTTEPVAAQPNGLPDDVAPGTAVRIATEDTGPDPVDGILLLATRTEISIRRDDPTLGVIHVHFPRLGYEVTPA